MGYRDDHAALLEKLRTLEAELEQYRGSERQALVHEVDSMRSEVEAAQARLASEHEVLANVNARLGAIRERLDPRGSVAPRGALGDDALHASWAFSALAFALVSSLVLGVWLYSPRGQCPHRTRSMATPPVASHVVPVEITSDAPSRADVFQALRALAPEVDRCANAHAVERSVLTARFELEGATGRVLSVRSDHENEALVDCVEDAAVEHAHVPPFATEAFTVHFPYRIRPQ